MITKKEKRPKTIVLAAYVLIFIAIGSLGLLHDFNFSVDKYLPIEPFFMEVFI
jgi:hypothetical protein